MQDNREDVNGYLQAQLWSESEFYLINSSSIPKPIIFKNLREFFSDYSNKPISVFSLSGTYSNDVAKNVRDIFLVKLLMQYCYELGNDDMDSLIWVKEQLEEIKNLPKFNLKSDIKKFMRSHMPYFLFAYIITLAFYNAFFDNNDKETLFTQDRQSNIAPILYIKMITCLCGGFYIAYKYGFIMCDALSSIEFFQGEPNYTFWNKFKSNKREFVCPLHNAITTLEDLIQKKENEILRNNVDECQHGRSFVQQQF